MGKETLALDTLNNQLQTLDLVDPECLPFHATGDIERRHETFDDPPRYLFRIFTPKSQGLTDSSWVKSMDARYEATNSRVDIFARADRQRTAEMINRHLRWWKGPDDNLVSWTSSLLFALTYIFHLHANTTHGSDFDNINLCIIDTLRFPAAVFLRDMDLIRAFRLADNDLRNFEGLRSKRSRRFSGSYYFGEYLSQGALKIEGKCQIVSGQDIISQGLYDILPEFEVFAGWEPGRNPPWADPVIELRERFYRNKTERQGISSEGLQAALNISQLFDSNWRLPIAASFIALAAPHVADEKILLAFRSPSFTGSHNPAR